MNYSFIIKNCLTLAHCFLYALIRGSAQKVVRDPSSFVVIQNAKLGDMVCTTPVFRAIKKKYEKARLVVIGNEINRQVVEGLTDVDEYMSKGIVRNMRKVLRDKKIDYGLLMTPDFNSLALLFLSGVKTIACPRVVGGFSPYETRSYKLLRKLAIDVPHQMGEYAPFQYLQLLKPVGISETDTTKRLTFSKQADEKVKDLLMNKGFIVKKDFIVGISPSAGNKIKTWGADRFAAVANHLSKHAHAYIIIVGSTGDQQEVTQMLQALNPNVKVLVTVGLLSIDELKALISRMDLFISVDTGPIYIAEAFNVPTIDIVGPMDEREQPPQGKYHKIVKVPDRARPELHIMNARVYNVEEAQRQVDQITSDMVIRVANELINELTA